MRKAASLNTTLLLADIVVAPHPGPTVTKIDLQMMAVVDGKERSMKQWKEVLEPSGWSLGKAVPTRSPHSIVVAKPV